MSALRISEDGDKWTFTWREHTTLGTVTYAQGEWYWHPSAEDPPTYGRTAIDVDPEQRLRFIAERQSVARMDPIIRDAMLAELEGRLRMFRDETKDMALMYARAKCRLIGRKLDLYDENYPKEL